MKPLLHNLSLSPFSDLKELISRSTYKTKTKPESAEVYNSGIIKKGLHRQCQTFL